jgi:hypothetical protein
MLLVLLSVLATPFLPLFLKGKCPNCGKRKLDSLESTENGGKNANPYVAYFNCRACHSKFMRDKSGPMQPVPDDSAVGTTSSS